jgi:hypothetical protein
MTRRGEESQAVDRDPAPFERAGDVGLGLKVGGASREVGDRALESAQ